MLGPLSAIATKWIRLDRYLYSLIALCSLSHLYLLVVAICHVHPPFATDTWILGWTMIIGANAIASMTTSYCSTLIFLMILNPSAQVHLAPMYDSLAVDQKEAFVQTASQFAGLALQACAMVGSFVMFGLVDQTRLFS